jgi:sulfonate transport system permease protein
MRIHWAANRSRFLGAIMIPAGLLLLWESAARFEWIPHSVFASFSESVVALVDLARSGELFRHTVVSVMRLLTGTILGSAIGIALGAAVAVSQLWERAIGPTMRFLSPVPPLAWIPLLIVLFGIVGARIALITLGTSLLMYAATLSGMRAVGSQFIEIATTYEKTKFQVLGHVLFPAALGNLISGARGAFAIAWILLVASELIASSDGLGWLMWNARSFGRPAEMLASCLAISILGYVTDAILAYLHVKMRPWQTDFRGL